MKLVENYWFKCLQNYGCGSLATAVYFIQSILMTLLAKNQKNTIEVPLKDLGTIGDNYWKWWLTVNRSIESQSKDVLEFSKKILMEKHFHSPSKPTILEGNKIIEMVRIIIIIDL